MCVVSMVMDHGRDVFWPNQVKPWEYGGPDRVIPLTPKVFIKPLPPAVPDVSLEKELELIEQFKKLVKKAAKYDAINDEPHCEDTEKIKVLEALEKRAEQVLKEIREMKGDGGIKV